MTNSSVLISLAIIIVMVVGFLFYMYHRPVPPGAPPEGAISITSTVSCLPHLTTSEPQTLECAYGLYDQQHGYYYAVDMGSSDALSLTQFPTGTKVKVEGTFMPGRDDVYDTIGTITITSIATEQGSPSMPASTSTSDSDSEHVTSNGILSFTVPPEYALAAAPEPLLVHSVIPPCAEGFDYCLYYNGTKYASTSFLSAGVSIQKVPSSQDEHECLTIAPEGYQDLKPTATSSGDSYAMSVFSPIGDGAAGSYSTGEEYRLFTSDTCYSLVARIGISHVSGSSSSSSSRADFNSSDQDDLMSQLRSILSDFTIVATGQHIVLPKAS